jgi:hypothetical protein
LLPPLFALATFALFPMVARAEVSSEKVYRVAPPSLQSQGPEQDGTSEAPNGNHPAPQTSPESHRSAAPKAGEEGRGGSASKPEGEPEPEERQKARAASPSGGGNHPPGDGGGRGRDASSRPERATPPKTHTAEGSGGGGSSPVVPILIAAALLAAASIGAVLYRERGPAIL